MTSARKGWPFPWTYTTKTGEDQMVEYQSCYDTAPSKQRMNTLQTITEALKLAKSNGIEIDFGACQSLNGGRKPTKVNWLGACYLYFSTDSLAEVLRHLGEDWIWFYRFNFGFNQGRHLDVLDKDNHVIGPDTVSQSAVKLAREFGLFR